MAKYQLVYADPPWHYKTMGKNGGASEHYKLMNDDKLKHFPIRKVMTSRAALFMWATCPRLDFAINLLEEWGLHYRGLAYIWVKTRQSDGQPMGAKGPPPAFVKATSELLLVATTTVKGSKVWPLQDLKQKQIVFEPVSSHSTKPDVFRENLEALAGPDISKLELFARSSSPGWDSWGYDCDDSVSLPELEQHERQFS